MDNNNLSFGEKWRITIFLALMVVGAMYLFFYVAMEVAVDWYTFPNLLLIVAFGIACYVMGFWLWWR